MTLNRYRGDGISPAGNQEQRYPYLADERLVSVVNMAIAIGRPLLIKGPPGCGKTELARSISHELGLPFYAWYVKSTSQANDGLYTIDVLRRLQDAQSNRDLAQSLVPYLRFGPLGKALSSSEQCVVLIDEIDKADIDFPNDLLRELDGMEFTIDELDEADALAHGFQKTYTAQNSPIVIITSNDEKELPDAFLRRCLFHYIDFPEKSRLQEIVKVNTSELDVDARLIASAVERFDQLCKAGSFRKQPATSELIDWVMILHRWGVDVEQLNDRTTLAELPYWTTLFKHQSDVQTVLRLKSGEPRQ